MTYVKRCVRLDSPVIEKYYETHGGKYVADMILWDEKDEHQIGVSTDCPADLRKELVDFYFYGVDIFADQAKKR